MPLWVASIAFEQVIGPHARPVIFVTGYVEISALGDIDETQIVRKPFIGNELADKVQTALATSAGNLAAKSSGLGDSDMCATEALGPLGVMRKFAAQKGHVRFTSKTGIQIGNKPTFMVV